MLRHDRTTLDGARFLVVVLRVLGGVDMLAFVAVMMPRGWIEVAHAWSGLGDFPDEPIAGYLARSASALYAFHGVLVVYMSFDVVRHWQLIRVFATLAVFHGGIMLMVDLSEGMPLWWTAVEGPGFATMGAAVLLTQRMTGPPSRRSLHER